MSAENQVNEVGQLYMQLSDLESELERVEKEGYAMAEHLKAIAEALEPPEVYIYDPIFYADDEVLSVAGYKSGGRSMIIGGNEYSIASYPDVKKLVKRLYDLKTEISKVKKELSSAEGRARKLRP